MGKLFLLPNVLDESLDHALFLPKNLSSIISQIQGLVAESEKSARRYLRRFLSHDEMAAMPLQLLNEHTVSLDQILQPLLAGQTWGLISDAGLPCIADPGSDLVAKAYEHGIEVQTFTGPSSLLMALQLSGFSGQRFAFHGYLEREVPILEKQIRQLELDTARATQIWIEAPYRSQKMLTLLRNILKPTTRLCVAASLTSSSQRVLSAFISHWHTLSFSLEKEPVVFLIA